MKEKKEGEIPEEVKKVCFHSFPIKYNYITCEHAEVRYTTDVYVYCHFKGNGCDSSAIKEVKR